jgi:sulfate permease, SulP family
MLIPKIATVLRNYTLKQCSRDVIAGIIVGIVALPLAIAFAIASGVAPEKGLYTAIIAGFIVSLLGGSRVQIGGPTGAFVVIVASIVGTYGINGLMIATIMAGVFLVLMGVFKAGGLIRFIPYPIVAGFTTGIAVIIFSSQVNDFFGMGIGAVPSEFVDKWLLYFKSISHVNFISLGVGAGSLLIILLWPRIHRTVPGSLIAIIAATLIVKLLDLPVETIGSKYGAIPTSLPSPTLPAMSFATIKGLVTPAMTIALLAAIESLLSAVVSDGMIGSKHRSNMELVAQGVANIASPLFGGIPATGAIARTATNVKNGGRTPIAGIVHAITLFCILLAFGKYAVLIPLPALAAVLIVVSYNMSEPHSFYSILRGQRSDALVLLIAFLLTVFVDLTVAIEVGIVAAAFIFMKKMVDITNIKSIKDEVRDEAVDDDPNSLSLRSINNNIQVFEIDGPFFFGTVHKFQDVIKQHIVKVKVLIIRMRDVPYLDADGLRTMEDIYRECKKHNCKLYISDIHTQPLTQVITSGLIEKIGNERFFGNLDDALEKAHSEIGVAYQKKIPPFEPTVSREKKA